MEEWRAGRVPDGDAQFNLNAYYLFSHIMLGQSRGQFLFSEGVLKAEILYRRRRMQGGFLEHWTCVGKIPSILNPEVSLSQAGYRRIDPIFNIYMFNVNQHHSTWLDCEDSLDFH